MKQKILLVLLSFICFSAVAQEVKTHLVVWAKDGTQVAYAFKEQPLITFSEAELLIRTSLLEVSYPLDQMAKFSYEKREEMEVRNISTNEPIFKLDGEMLLFLHLQPNSIVALYTPSGQVVFSRTISTYGEYAFPIVQLAHGIYMVQVNGLTYKIAR